MQPKETLLLIDFSNTVIRSLAVHQQLSFNDIPTGGLFGFVNQLANMINLYKPDKILVCKDQSPYFRSKLYPEYKANRKKNTENDAFKKAIKISFQQIDTLLEIFKIPTWSIPGSEADDLIAEVIIKSNETIPGLFDKIFVLSNDDDLNQLLYFDNISLIRKNKEYDYKIFKQEFPNIEPADWVLLTALTGTHNGVEGIPRVGLKTALKIINDDTKLNATLEQYKDLIERNYSLIELPLFESANVSIPYINRPELNEAELIRYLEAFGIRYALHMTTSFFKYSTRNPRNVR